MSKNIEAIYPLSPTQEGMLFHTLHSPQSEAYFVQVSCLLEGELNVAAFKQAWQEVTDHHAILRTAFVWERVKRPLQVVRKRVALAWDEQDWRAFSVEEQEAKLKAYAGKNIKTGFTLSEAPLMRFALIQSGPKAWRFVWSHHHLLLDGWCGSFVLNDVLLSYKALVNGTRRDFPSLRPYEDYIGWLQKQDSLEAERFWRQTLKGFTAATPFGMDNTSVRERTEVGDQRVRLSGALTGALQMICRRHQLTMNTLLQGAWALLLHRYSGQNDILFGLSVSGRPAQLPGVETMVGLFINTLPVRVQIEPQSPVVNWLKQLQQAQATLKDYEYSSLAEVQQWSEIARGTPLFESILVFENFPFEESTAREDVGFQVRNVAISEKMNYPLAVSAWGDSELILRITYDIPRFQNKSISQMLKNLECLLENIAANPEQPIFRLRILSEAEREQLIHNSNSQAETTSKSVVELFEDRVRKSGHARAVVSGNRSLTYEEVNGRANQLARRLRQLGVRPEVMVGICLERSAELVVALLAVLKAGGAYVPLDPDYPLERLDYVLRDCGAAVLLTQKDFEDRLPRHDGLVVYVDEEEVGGESVEDLKVELWGENMAYMIYTSGSTGRPKGAMNTHGGLSNLVWEQIAGFPIEEGSRVLQFASTGFDASVSEIFTTLVGGGELHLGKRSEWMPGAGLEEALKEHKIQVVTLPPSALAVMAGADLEELKTVVSAGEACGTEMAMRWSQGRRLLNAYGPTETAVCASMGVYEGQGNKPGIGKPLGNVEIYLLDGNLEPVPIGVAAEIYIGGRGVGRGYLNRADLTGERFVPHPFSREGGQRLYRTGDMGKYLEGGSIDYLGRRDEQVKVRGYRIELGEIESVLNSHAQIRESVVIAREDEPGDKRLVAYIVSKDQQPIEMWPSVAEYFVYDDLLYYAMTSDDRRNASYKVAIKRVVADKVVLDIGTGKDAILARLCIEAGARKVYAIELLQRSYEQAKAQIKALGLEDKIILIHGDSLKVELPEKVDVCVSELVGPIGGVEGAPRVLNDAKRFLKEGAAVIPERSVTQIAAVEMPEEFLKAPRFERNAAQYIEQIFEQVGYKFDLRLCVKGVGRSHLLSNEDIFEDLNFTEIASSEYQRTVRMTMNRSGNLDGLLVWLNLYTSKDEMLNILDHQYCWLPVYFPVFYPGIAVEAGDRIEAVVKGSLSENKLNPDYKIEGEVIRKNGAASPFKYESWHNQQNYRAHPFYQQIFDETRPLVNDRNGSELNLSELRTHLKRYLPDYMMPSAIEVMDRLPLTAHGKINRAALPKPGGNRLETADNSIPPRTVAEEVLMGVWSQVLKLDHIGVRDDFFELGGHSLLATQVIARIREIFSTELPLHSIFDSPTIEGLAEKVEEMRRSDRGVKAPPLEKQERGAEAPLSFSQERFWFLQQLRPNNLAYNIPAVIRLKGVLNVEAMEQTLNEIIRRHEILRTTFEAVGGKPRQKIQPLRPFSLAVIDLEGLEKNEREASMRRLAKEEAQRPFDLAKGPLIRFQLLKFNSAEHVVLFTMHHIITDGWSVGVLNREVSQLYEAYSASRPSPLTELPVQYADFAIWQRNWLRREVVDEQLVYWKKHLQQLSPLALPYDKSRPEIQSFLGATESIVIPKETAARLKSLADEEGATLFMVLLAAVKTLLQRYTSQDDIVVGAAIANRSHTKLEELIGYFANTLLYRTSLKGDPTFRELLKRVRQVTLEAYAHQDLPFETLVEHLQPERKLDQTNPLIQVAFGFQKAPDEVEWRGLSMQTFRESEKADAIVDLSIFFSETPGNLKAALIYDEALFNAPTIQAMARHLREIIEQAAKDWNQPLSALGTADGSAPFQTLELETA